MDQEGFGKISQLRTTKEVIEDAKRVFNLLNAILEELGDRGIVVHIVPEERNLPGTPPRKSVGKIGWSIWEEIGKN